jgi:plasmid stabilization system protein ParE
MPQVRLSGRARLDLVRLHKFLAERDTAVASRAIDEIQASLIPLTRMPKIGRLADDGLRELIIDFGSSGYLVLYDFDETIDEIVVLAVRHQKEIDYK